MRENLLLVARDFVRRSRTHSQAEDFFTEVLAALLRLSPDFRTKFLALVLGDPEHRATALPFWEITTHEEAESDEVKYGVPDLVLNGAESEDAPPSHLIAVEVKLDATLGSKQLTKYDTWLGEEQPEYEFVSLSALTTSERAYSAAQEAQSALEHWSSWIRWSQVEEILSSVLEHETSATDRPQSNAEEQHLFRVYGQAFDSLLADEGLVPPSPLRPSADAALLQTEGSDELQRRQVNLAHLLHQALRDAGVLRILSNRDPTWQPMRARDGLPHRTQHQKGVQLRQRLQVGPYRGVFFSFGLAYHARGWLLRDKEIPHDFEYLNLVAALEIWDVRGRREANHLSWVLSGENRMVRPAAQLCDELNSVSGLEEELFVPDVNYRWAKLVCRRSTEKLAGASKEAQKAEIGRFFRAFLDSFSDANGEALGYPDVSSLRAIENVLKSSSL